MPLSPLSRRSLMTAGLAAAVGATLTSSSKAEVAQNPLPAADRLRGLKLAVASYTFRQKALEPTIQGIQKVGLSYVSIKDAHLPLKSTADERKAVAAQFKAAGITPLSCGVVALGNKMPTMRQAFEYARDAGIPTIVCAPVADALHDLEGLVKEFDIRLAIHNHGPGDKWPTPNEIYPAIKALDPRIGLCVDVGHTARAGADPAECITKYKDRVFDIHLKDVDAIKKEGKPVEVGRGVLDLRSILAALIETKFQGLVSFEYEKDGADPLPGLAESVGYVRGILSDLKTSV